MQEVNITRENLIEFDFENFFIFFDKKRDIWFMEFFNEDDEEDMLVLQDGDSSFYNNEKKFLEFLGFLEADFTRIKSFVKGKQG